MLEAPLAHPAQDICTQGFPVLVLGWLSILASWFNSMLPECYARNGTCARTKSKTVIRTLVMPPPCHKIKLHHHLSISLPLTQRRYLLKDEITLNVILCQVQRHAVGLARQFHPIGAAQ